MSHPTSTTQGSLVIHRVSQTSVEVWGGTLFPTMKMPDRARVRLFEDNCLLRSRIIRRKEWKCPFWDMERRFFFVVKFQRLTAVGEYHIEFERHIEENSNIGINARWQKLRSGQFRTLPSSLPLKGQDVFTIALGSCFYNHRDGGQAAASYKALYDRGDSSVRSDLTVLTGDQVYLEIGFDSQSLIPHEIRERIADVYALHWQVLGSILNRGGTWVLPDDHEYWNDYPFVDSLIP